MENLIQGVIAFIKATAHIFYMNRTTLDIKMSKLLAKNCVKTL